MQPFMRKQLFFSSRLGFFHAKVEFYFRRFNMKLLDMLEIRHEERFLSKIFFGFCDLNTKKLWIRKENYEYVE